MEEFEEFMAEMLEEYNYEKDTIMVTTAFAQALASEWCKKQVSIHGVSLSAYMVVCEPDGKRLAVIAESIGDACDKLDEQGYFDYQFVRSVSFDVLH